MKKIDVKNYQERFNEVCRKCFEYFESDGDWFPYLKMNVAYFLWKIKTDKSIKNMADMESRGYYRKGYTFCYMGPGNDISEYFSEFPEEEKELFDLSECFTESELIDMACELPADKDSEIISKNFSELIDGLLKISGKEKVLNVGCGNGEFLFQEQKKHENTNFFGSDDISIFQVACQADAKGYHQIAFSEEVESFDDLIFDKIFINSFIREKPRYLGLYGISDNNITDISFKDDEIEYLSLAVVIRALSYLNKHGRIVAIIGAGSLTGKADECIRKYLCENGFVEGVISLPDKMFSNTWLNPQLLIIGHNCKEVKFVDARNCYQNDRLLGKRINVFSENDVEDILSMYNAKDTSSVNIKVLKENNYNLNPLRYTVKEDLNTVCLGDYIKEIRRGITLTAKQMDEVISEERLNYYKCIIPSSISNNVVLSKLYYNGTVKKNNNTAYTGDILISRDGTPFKVAVSDDYYIVVGNVYIIRIDNSKIDSEYIHSFLTSSMGQRELSKYVSGTKTPILKVDDLKKIQIPVFEGKKQKKAVAKAKELHGELVNAYKQIVMCKEEVNNIFQ